MIRDKLKCSPHSDNINSLLKAISIKLAFSGGIGLFILPNKTTSFCLHKTEIAPCKKRRDKKS
jgi:hypothetical protein